MIFGKDYDRSLWYIVNGDKKNSKKLVQFLRELPIEIVDKARATIAKKDELEGDVSFGCRDKVYTDVYYDFDYTSYDSCITITKGFDDGKLGEDQFELMLFPVTKEELELMEFSDELWLGTVTDFVATEYISDNMQITDEDEREYNIHHFPIGYYVSHAREIFNGKRELVLYKRVNNKKIPENITRNNISQRLLTKRN